MAVRLVGLLRGGARRAAGSAPWLNSSRQRCCASAAHAAFAAEGPDAADARRRWAACVAAAALSASAIALAERDRRGAGPARCASVRTQRVCLGKAEEMQDGTMREVPVGPEGSGSTVLLHRHAGAFFATGTLCPHTNEKLVKGVTTAGGRGGAPSVTGPLHDATFDLQTGKAIRGPRSDGIATYKVEVRDGSVYADIPSDIVAGTGEHAIVVQKMARRNAKDARVFAIVGGGTAALAACETLRQEGFGGRVVMITKEAHLPYDRTMLSKAPGTPADEIFLRPPSFFKDHDIEVVHEAFVTKLDPKDHEIQYKIGEDAAATTSLKYDKCLVATGGSPRKLFVPGANLKGVYTLRTPEDSAEIARHAKRGQKIVIVGGSFIGMEMASGLRKSGCDVSVIALESVPFERVLGKKVGAAFARLLAKNGVEWLGNAQVRLFRGNNRVAGVELEDGEVLPADAVVIGAGVLPNTRFVEGVSLDKNGAIIVGPLLNCENAPTLFAAGDVCAYPAMVTGSRVRIEHWDVATQQGRVAARNMLDQYKPFKETPYFWSGLFGKSLSFVGHAPEVLDRVIIEGDVSGMEFISYYTEDDEVRAVATVNREGVAGACAELMRRGKMPRVSELMLGVANADTILERLQRLSQASAR